MVLPFTIAKPESMNKYLLPVNKLGMELLSETPPHWIKLNTDSSYHLDDDHAAGDYVF